MSIASWTSPRASAITFPISRVISCETSSLWSARSCPKRKRISPRRGAGTRRHSSKAEYAASTARSTSSAPDFGKTPTSSPVAGLRLSNVWPAAASTHSPPTKFLNVRAPVTATGPSLRNAPPRRDCGTGSRACPASGELLLALRARAAEGDGRVLRDLAGAGPGLIGLEVVGLGRADAAAVRVRRAALRERRRREAEDRHRRHAGNCSLGHRSCSFVELGITRILSTTGGDASPFRVRFGGYEASVFGKVPGMRARRRSRVSRWPPPARPERLSCPSRRSTITVTSGLSL